MARSSCMLVALRYALRTAPLFSRHQALRHAWPFARRTYAALRTWRHLPLDRADHSNMVFAWRMANKPARCSLPLLLRWHHAFRSFACSFRTLHFYTTHVLVNISLYVGATAATL